MMLQKPPEGVTSGNSIPRENEATEFEELYLKAKERHIKSLERMEEKTNG